MIINAKGIDTENGVSSFDVGHYSSIDPNANNKCFKDIKGHLNIVKAEYNDEKDYANKIISIGFCDIDAHYEFAKGTQILMRNGTYKSVEHLKAGDLCMTRSEIKPLKHIGEVRYVSEIYPEENLIECQVYDDKADKLIENISLTNGVFVKQ